RSLEIPEKDERTGCHSRQLGAATCKIVECTNPPFRTKVGPWIQVLFAKSKKWLPDAVMQYALRIFYAIK
ncbi:SDR family NAD(P)-dependent oxidoreductase, partial [Escherichia coli]|nr:SDR family NAD(P)-dependent oxidoreductase [Escherichia coli]